MWASLTATPETHGTRNMCFNLLTHFSNWQSGVSRNTRLNVNGRLSNWRLGVSWNTRFNLLARLANWHSRLFRDTRFNLQARLSSLSSNVSGREVRQHVKTCSMSSDVSTSVSICQRVCLLIGVRVFVVCHGTSRPPSKTCQTPTPIMDFSILVRLVFCYSKF